MESHNEPDHDLQTAFAQAFDLDRPPARPYVDELARIEAAYKEIQRRDGAAWWHASQWRKVALVAIAAILVLLSVILYLALQQSQVQAFVQAVQVTEEGRLVQVGVPMDLFDYKPQEGEWMNMLVQWVRNYRWRVDETLTHHNWAWLARHTCGAASTQLKRDEDRLQPYKPGKRLSVAIKSVTKTDTPESYQVLWEELDVSEGVTMTKPRSHTGTFTVARLRPKKMSELLDNRLGQCVNGYSIFPVVMN